MGLVMDWLEYVKETYCVPFLNMCKISRKFQAEFLKGIIALFQPFTASEI
jgi:hypothetical protein